MRLPEKNMKPKEIPYDSTETWIDKLEGMYLELKKGGKGTQKQKWRKIEKGKK